MTNWTPDLAAHSGPRYRAIVDALAQDVATGRFKAGDRLPTHRDLAWRLGVTVGTVSRAYAEAERRGLIAGEVGRGTFVRGPAPGPGLAVPAKPADGLLDLAFNFPAPGLDEAALAPTLEALAADPGAAALLRYQAHAGMAAHREAGAAWLARAGLEVPPDRVVLTAGAQHGILVALAALTRPGDQVLAEGVTYPGIQLVARLLGLRLEGLAMDAEGVLPEALDAACSGGDYRALYCIPTLQNPTTATMSAARRQAIAGIARRHNLAIVEDDIFRRLLAEAPPPLSALAPEQGYYVTSLSKTTAPGLRVGYLAAPAGAVEKVALAVRTTCWMAPALPAEIASRWIRDGSAERILEARRQEAGRRRARALEILGRWPLDCAPGSLHLWLHLPEPWRATDFAAAARRRGVGITPAEAFILGRRNLVHAVRVCYGAVPGFADMERALEILAELLADRPTQAHGAVV